MKKKSVFQLFVAAILCVRGFVFMFSKTFDHSNMAERFLHYVIGNNQRQDILRTWEHAAITN